MSESLTLPRVPSTTLSENYAQLREEGIRQLQKLTGEIWTDHNVHDPGITILEALCYAITEVGFNSQLEIEDLLSSSRKDPERPHFFTAGEILPCAPFTIDDYRKLLIDLPLVKNAWLEVATRIHPPIFFIPDDYMHTYNLGERVNANGLYEVLLEFEDDPDLGDLNSTILTVNNVEVNYADAALNPVQVFHDVEFSYPFWDEVESAPFKSIQTVSSITGPGGGSITLLNAVEDDVNDYFANIEVNFGSQSQVLGISITITTELGNEPDERTQLETEILNLLTQVAPSAFLAEPLINQFNQKVAAAYHNVKQVVESLSDKRNVSEDFAAYRAVRIQEIGVSSIIEIRSGLDVESMLAEIFFEIDRFLAPQIQRYSYSQMEESGFTVEEILEGPLLQNGFIKTDELRELDGLQGKGVLYVSDLLHIILETSTSLPTDTGEQTEGDQIVSLQELRVTNYIRNKAITRDVSNCLILIDTRLYKPRLSINKSSITIIQNGLETSYNLDRVIAIYEELKQADIPEVDPEVSALTVPEGDQLPVGSYHSIQHGFPLIYGLGKGHLSKQASEERIAQARQLKAYLLFFEQILANQFSLLANIDELFSLFASPGRTFFAQSLTGLPDLEDLLFDQNAYLNQLENSQEDRIRFQRRRTQLLNHLLARYGEDMSEYALMKYTIGVKGISDHMQLEPKRLDITDEILDQKLKYLQALAYLNQNRGQGFDYLGYRRQENLRVEEISPNNFRWFWDDYNGTPQLRSPGTYTTAEDALEAGKEVLHFGTTEAYYRGVAGNRFELYNDLALAPANLVAHSARNYASLPEANDAIEVLVSQLRYVWDNCNVSGLERKLTYLLDIKTCKRRSLGVPFNELLHLVDIRNVNIGGGQVRQRFSLLDESGIAILRGTRNYNSFAEAAENAELAMRLGGQRNQYAITIDSLGRHVVRLLNDAEPPVYFAARTGTYNSLSAAEAEIERLAQYYYDLYSREGFHMVEHILLRPRDRAQEGLLNNTPVPVPGTTDNFLAVLDLSENAIRDPFSFIVSFVFPSGYAYDFASPPSDMEDAASTPAAFREPEYRQYAELTIRRELPAHILPRFFWLPVNTGLVNNTEISLNRFESLYRTWLEANASFELDQQDISSAQNELVAFLNALDASQQYN
jgi:hypothetical protein